MKYDANKYFVSLTSSYSELGDSVIPVIRTLTDCVKEIAKYVNEKDFFSVIYLPIAEDSSKLESYVEKIDNKNCAAALKVLRLLYLKDIKLLEKIIKQSEQSSLSQQELERLSETAKAIVALHIINIQSLAYKNSAQYLRIFSWMTENSSPEETKESSPTPQQTRYGKKRTFSSE